jgi:hypothetical protein
VHTTVKWICWSLLLIAPMAWAQGPPPDLAPGAVPDWMISSSPARFVIEMNQNSKPTAISFVSLCMPNPAWLNMPIRVFAENGTPVGSDLLWTAPGEPATLAFDSSSGSKQYKIYMGSNWPAMHLNQPKSGVIMESRAMPPSDFKVISADYFVGDIHRDVTKLVQPMAKSGRLLFNPVDGNMGGDPKHGTVKTFRIQYSYGGQNYDESFRQGAQVMLPKRVWVNSLDDMLQQWNKSPTIYGRAMIPAIFEGGNRFGNPDCAIDHFQGWFDVAAPEHLLVQAESFGISYVLIDGKEVVKWPQSPDKGMVVAASPDGAIDLAPGTHTLEYYVAYYLWAHPLLCCVGVRNNATQQWTPLVPGNTFLRPSGEAHVIDYDVQSSPDGGAPPMGNTPPFAIDWTINGQSFIDPGISDIGLISVQLACRTSLIGTVTWTFDDGTTATGPTVQHIFPRPGMRTVKVAIVNGANNLGSLTQVINVHLNWLMLNGAPPQIFPDHLTNIGNRDPMTLSPSDLAGSAAVFGIFKNYDALRKFIPALCAKMKDISATDLPYLKTAAVNLGMGDPLHYADAILLLQALVDRCSAEKPTPDIATVNSDARLILAELIWESSDQTAAIKPLLDGIDVKALSFPEPQRQVDIVRADLILASGDVAGARKQYEKLVEDPTGPDVRSSFRLTSGVSHARAYLDRKDYESASAALGEIAWDSPVQKLSPDWALTQLRLEEEEGMTAPAYFLAVRLLPVVMEGGRSDLLFRLTDLAFSTGHDDVGKTALTELLQKHSYSEEAARAKQKWSGKVP